jgi:hypothetical protein
MKKNDIGSQINDVKYIYIYILATKIKHRNSPKQRNSQGYGSATLYPWKATLKIRKLTMLNSHKIVLKKKVSMKKRLR